MCSIERRSGCLGPQNCHPNNSTSSSRHVTSKGYSPFHCAPWCFRNRRRGPSWLVPSAPPPGLGPPLGAGRLAPRRKRQTSRRARARWLRWLRRLRCLLWLTLDLLKSSLICCSQEQISPRRSSWLGQAHRTQLQITGGHMTRSPAKRAIRGKAMPKTCVRIHLSVTWVQWCAHR